MREGSTGIGDYFINITLTSLVIVFGEVQLALENRQTWLIFVAYLLRYRLNNFLVARLVVRFNSISGV